MPTIGQVYQLSKTEEDTSTIGTAYGDIRYIQDILSYILRGLAVIWEQP